MMYYKSTTKKTPIRQSKESYSKSLIFIIPFILICLLVITSCTKQIYPQQSFVNIQSQAERNKLKDFRVAGTEKMINTQNVKADEIIKTAQQYLGVPHCMGGTTMKCIDCSGLLFTVFAKHGIRLPHSSEEQARYGRVIAGMNKLKEGDMVFFINTYKTNRLITHSGIYIGDNKFIHTSTSKGVTITSLNDSYWNEKFIFGTRVFE